MESQITLFFLMLCRWTPFFMAVGNGPLRWFPAPVRLAILLIMTLFSLSFAEEVEISIFSFIREFAIGVLLVFELNVIFSALSFWGRLIDQQIGFLAAGIFNPGSQEQEPLTGSAILLASSALFFSLDLHHVWLHFILESYSWLPVEEEFDFYWLWRASLGFGTLFISALVIFLPTIVGLWVFDACSAFLSRFLPQMNVYFVGMPLKILFGLVLLSLSVGSLAPFLSMINNHALKMTLLFFKG